MQLNDLPRQGQSDAESAGFGARSELPVAVEDLVAELWWNADPVVADGESHGPTRRAAAPGAVGGGDLEVKPAAASRVAHSV